MDKYRNGSEMKTRRTARVSEPELCAVGVGFESVLLISVVIFTPQTHLPTSRALPANAQGRGP